RVRYVFTDLSTPLSTPFPRAPSTVKYVLVALDVPLDERFDFRLPEGMEAPIGSLVVVPFGRTRKVGVVVDASEPPDLPPARIRSIESVVADVAPFRHEELELFEFCAAYYQRALGEVIAA